MGIKKRLLAGAAATVVLTVFGSGIAASAVVVTDVELAGPGGYYTVDINGEDVYDAALVLTIDGHKVLVNCDDLFHNIYLGSQNTPFVVSNFSSATNPTDFGGGSYSKAQITAMSWLLDTSATIWKAGPSGNSNEQLDLAALQLASWMVGNPEATYSNYNSSVYSLAQTYISQVDQTSFPGTYVAQLSSDYGVQGQIVDPAITPIPEPGSWMMMLLGLGMIGVGLRTAARRKSAVAPAAA